MRFQTHGSRPVFTLTLLLVTLLLASCQPGTPGADPRSLSWQELEKSVQGTTVRFAMWSGDERINAWIDNYVAGLMKSRYQVTLERVPMDASVFVNKLSSEKKADKPSGSLDLLWINGENFARAKNEGLLFGPFAEKLPHWKYVDPQQVSLDFGVAVEGYEVPYGKAQFVFEYDSALYQDLPRTFRELGDWVKRHPGKFTYPMPPDFTGSAFLRQALYEIGGGYEAFLQPGNTAEFERRSALLFAWLNEIKPYLWQEGRVYPADKPRLDALFSRGEVALGLSYTQAGAQGLIESGTYPATVRTFVMDKASLSNYHFTAIPFNAPNPGGAMVLTNLLLSPEVQLHKNNPRHWGDFTVLDMDRLEASDQKAFADLELGAATLDLASLGRNAVPEILPEYLLALDKGWVTEVLRKD